MGKYYGIFCSIAVFLFGLLFLLTGVSSCNAENGLIDDAKDFGKETAVVRYYMDDDLVNAKINYIRVKKNEEFYLVEIPYKAGYMFKGLVDSMGNLYVDAGGTSLIMITGDVTEILLYPQFVKL